MPIPGAEAGEDLSAKQFYFVALNASGQFVTPTAAGARAHGVLQDAPVTAGQAAEIAPIGSGGVSKLKLASACTAGDLLYTSASGTAVTSATGSGVALAVAMETRASGAVVTALLGVSVIV
jgi:hypothetical protein